VQYYSDKKMMLISKKWLAKELYPNDLLRDAIEMTHDCNVKLMDLLQNISRITRRRHELR